MTVSIFIAFSIFLSLCKPVLSEELDISLFHTVYSSVFTMRDGSRLSFSESRAVDAMQGSVQRLLSVGKDTDLLGAARELKDEDLLRILFLAVVGNFTVDQSPSALPQRCALVIDPASGGFVLKDTGATQSVILEVLLLVSIVCLLKAWKS
jgi:hypothetical protein